MLENSPLGKKTAYPTTHDKNLLFPIPRAQKRQELGLNLDNPGFYGIDIWNHYEISWLNLQGKPIVAHGEIQIPASSPNIIEAKSLKLYFNSFNNTKFENKETFIALVENELSEAVTTQISFKLYTANDYLDRKDFSGLCLDDLDITCDTYQPYPEYLECESSTVNNHKVYSNLLKSNCLITGQPDWGNISIQYSGLKINEAGLLRYIISLRNHNEFHEQCVERIFHDISTRCKPSSLTVYARYTRRGGLDTNPYRTSNINYNAPHNLPTFRQ